MAYYDEDRQVKIPGRFFVHSKIPQPNDVNVNFVYNYFVPDESVNDTGTSKYDPGFGPGANITGQSFFVDSNGNKMFIAPNGTIVPASDVLMRSPRQNEVLWTPPVFPDDLTGQEMFTPIFSLEEAEERALIVYEEDIRSVLDTSVSVFDPRLPTRLQKKANLLCRMSGISPHCVAAPNTLINALGAVGDGEFTNQLFDDTGDITKLFDLNIAEDTKRVNELSPADPIPAFAKAASSLLEVYVDRRMIKDLADSNPNRFSVFRNKYYSYFENDVDQRAQLPFESTPALKVATSEEDRQKDVHIETPFLPAWIISPSTSAHLITTSGNYNLTKLQGYIVSRYDLTIEDITTPTKTWYVEGDLFGGPNVVDTEIVYGKEYYYTVRAVYCREFFDVDYYDLKFKRMQQWIASKPTEPKIVKTVEYTPPTSPDGLFYKFNYGAGKGLILNWQYPVGKSRDTKYFQIFRRKSIHQPFQCIAELDFNDSYEPYARREKVDPKRVHKFAGTVTAFEDSEFDRDSSYIYAVAAIDAHGLTSGYSHQTQVTFNRSTNSIDLKGVSRADAPKQYPNFFVDPDMDETTFVRTFTQDVMSTSGASKVSIYFTPDVENYGVYPTPYGTPSTPDPAAPYEDNNNVIYAGGPAITEFGGTGDGADSPAYFKMHLINLDRQKDDSIEIRISDFRGVEITPQY